MSRPPHAVRSRRTPAWKAVRPGLSLALICPALLSAAGAEGPAPPRLPPPGTILERELAGGEVHRYALAPGEERWIAVDQDGIDVTVSVLAADGEVRLAVDSPGGLWGEEGLLVEAAAAGGEAIEVRAFEPHAAPGRYRLRLEPGSAHRRQAQRAITEAGRLHHAGTREARRRALERYREALAEWQALGRDAEAARTYFLLAMLERRLGEPREALPLLRRALAEWRYLGDRRGVAQAGMEIASTARILGEATARVEEAYREALALWRELGDLHGQARTLNYLGLIRARAAPPSALAVYGEALELFRRLGDVLQEGVVLNNLGGVNDLLGEPRPALEHYRRALEIHRRLGDRRQVAAVWNNIAAVHRRTGRLQEALEGFGRSLEIRRQLGDRRGEGLVLNNLGLTWLSLGDVARARDAFGEALLLRRASDDGRGEAITLHNLGLVHAEIEEWETARELWGESLARYRTLMDRHGETRALVVMGWAEGHLGRAAARPHLEDALDLLEDGGKPWWQAHTWRFLGEALTASGETAEALAALERSLGLYRATGDEVGEGDALLALARAQRAGAVPEDGGRLESAYGHASAALDLLEEVRAGVDSLGLRSSFLSRHREAFELAVDLAMDLERREPSAGWAAKALEVSERARARSLVDLLQEAGAGLRRGVDAALLDRQQELLERLHAKVARRRRLLEYGGPPAESARLAGEVAALLSGLRKVEDGLRRQSPGWADLARPRALGAGALRALLDAETILLEYSLGEERSFLWAVTARRIDGFELPGRAAIEAAAREVFEGLSIQDPRALAAERAAAVRLSEVLLGPVRDRLTGKRLAIVADGALHYLPFAALPHPSASSEPLVARHEIVHLPSASALAVQRRILAGRRPAKKVLAVLADPVFGAPDPRLADAGPGPPGAAAHRAVRAGDSGPERLAWSRWEAQTIAAHAGDGQALVLLGFDAGLEAVRRGRLRGYRVVHFATHGLIDGEHPELSALVLSLYDAAGRPHEGFLRLPEIYNLELDAELVVLSGCRTALGREIRGEGLVGLTRGFFAAGARRLVASLWRVQDRSTAELMDRFYQRLWKGDPPPSPAAALRAAQLELMSEPEFRDPYHWAAFAVYGDWR